MSSRYQVDSPEHAATLHRAADHETTDSANTSPAPHPLVALQGQVGNAAVARMLAQRAEDEEEVQAKHDTLQRAEDEEDQVQAKPEVGLAGGPLSADLSGRINARRGAGAALDGGTRTSMEQSFGASFEDVRVHTDGESDALNRSISAKAFTTGSDVFFRNDTSPSDHSLLAHELTHVVQQRGMSGGAGGMSVGAAGDSQEQQADSVAAAVTSGSAAQAQREAEQAQIARVAAAQREEAQEEEQAQ